MQQQQQQYVFFFFSHKEIKILALRGEQLLWSDGAARIKIMLDCDAETANCTAIRDWQAEASGGGSVHNIIVV
jgi:hypothetical protein